MRRALKVLLSGAVAVVGVTAAWHTMAGISEGMETYAQYCESCHGVDGQGVGGMGELVSRGQLLKPDEQLFELISEGQMSMPGFDGLLTGEEIRDLILYLRTIQ